MNILSILAWKDALIPERVSINENTITLEVTINMLNANCPSCGQPSSSVHSHYQRHIADLPIAARMTSVVLNAKKFRCRNTDCPCKIFCERLVSVPTYSRRTARLAHRLRQIAYQLGGQAGARLATLLGMPVSDTTLVRLLQASKIPAPPTPKVLGVDDWSLKKGQTYGTILIDMEKHKPIDLLPDREAETLTQWLRDHPGVEIICRDRASGYIEGATNGAPQALQIADRWHLLKNLGEALQRMLDKKNAQLREAAQQLASQQQAKKYEQQPTYEEVVGPHISLSSATARRAQIFQEVKQLLAEGYSSRKIAKRLKIGRNTVNRYRHMDRYREKSRPKKQQSTVLPYRDYLARRWAEGERDRKQLWRELQQ